MTETEFQESVTADIRMLMDMQAVESFRALCKCHDLTHDYSDDGDTYRRGALELKEIGEAATRLPRSVAVRVWNEVVDEKLRDGTRFYWKE